MAKIAMDNMYHEMDRESGKVEQIVNQFHLKILHVILDSRIASLHHRDSVGGDFTALSRVKKSDKWFNLILGDRPAALENLNFWHRNLFDPMIIDIILAQRGSSPAPSMDHHFSLSTPGSSSETVIERWVIQYENPRIPAPQSGDSSASYRKTYKKLIILLRSIYAQMRILPAYRIFRQLASSSQTYNFDLIYRISSVCEPFSRAEDDMMKEYSFVPIEAFPGHLCVSVTHRPTLSNFNLQPVPSMPPKIITDYVGSPTTDPMRSFRSSDKGFIATSFPFRFIGPSSAPPPRPHSWSSGFHARPSFTANQPIAGSPPITRITPMPSDIPSPFPDINGSRTQNSRMRIPSKTAVNDDYQLSPPFSPSASPSTPSYLSGGNSLLAHDRTGTAPVTIPHSLTSRSSRCISPYSSDPSKHSLPPMSPKSLKHDASSHESPSGIRSYRKIESLRAGDSSAGFMNHNYGQKVGRDSKDDSGRFSGLLSSSGSPRVGFSRSSSRLSLQDDFDECEFSCPFDVDDVETSENQASQIFDKRKSSDSASQSSALGRKSQDAAVGVLVHMLRTAPPLRQDSGCQSSHLLRPECEGVGTASGFLVSRRTTDALEELRSYREMKDLLLSKSGNRVLTKEKV